MVGNSEDRFSHDEPLYYRSNDLGFVPMENSDHPGQLSSLFKVCAVCLKGLPRLIGATVLVFL